MTLGPDTNTDQARAAGRLAAEEGGVPLHDIGGHVRSLGLTSLCQSVWICGLEDGLEEMGFDTDPDSDGHAAERRALARSCV